MNNWQRSMYDFFHAANTIGSKDWETRTRQETDFLVGLFQNRPGAKWLDVPCGTGRHAIRLGQAGYKVTGLDISEDCLTIARENNSHSNVRYVRGDMSRLSKFKKRFDIVSNLFSSIGYFSTDAENKKVLAGMIDCLTPGGTIIVHTVNRDALLSRYAPSRWSQEDSILFVESNRFNAKTKYFESLAVYHDTRTGRSKNYYSRIRLYSKSEMVALLKSLGLKRIRVFGSFDGSPFHKNKSTHPIYTGEK